MYGKFPGIALVFHVIISGFLIAAAFTWLFPLAIVGLTIYVIKFIVMLIFQKEMKAFRNMRSTQETDQFLQGLRQKTPTAELYVTCYHMETHVYRDSNGHMKTRQDKVVTFRQHRYIQITGFYDTTPPLYVKVYKNLIYLELSSSISWLGQS